MSLSFADATAVRQAGPGTFDVDLDPVWGTAGHPNGGYVLATMTRAALAAAGREHPHAASASFLRPITGGAGRIEVTVLHAGRTATHLRAVLAQGGEPVVETTLVVGDAPAGDAAPALPHLVLAPLQQCVAMTTRSRTPNLLQRVAVHYVPGFGPREPSSQPVLRAWQELRSGEQPDVLTALLACDALAPSVLRLGHRGWAPTVQMTVQLYASPTPGPLAIEVSTGQVRAGWFDEETTVADAAGAVLARARQLARLPAERTSSHPPR